jgi:hypothetical protein
MVYFIGSSVVDQTSINKKLGEAHGLVWEDGDKHIIATVTRITEGELNSYEIKLIDSDSNFLFKDIFVVDTDMYGGGFVKATQIDSDHDPELIIWGSHERDKSYVLDFSEGKINKTEFNKLPESVHELTKRWHKAHIEYRATAVLLAILAVGYYGILMAFWLAIKIIQRFKKRRA